MGLNLQSISKNHGTKQSLKNITFTFGTGIPGLLGSTGAGKSTLMKMLSPVEIPTIGTILFKGQDLVNQPNNLRRALRYLPRDFGISPNKNPVEFLEQADICCCSLSYNVSSAHSAL